MLFNYGYHSKCCYAIISTYSISFHIIRVYERPSLVDNELITDSSNLYLWYWSHQLNLYRKNWPCCTQDLGANFKAYCLATNLNCPWMISMYFYSTPFLNRIMVHNYIGRTQIFAIHWSPISFTEHNEPYGHCNACQCQTAVGPSSGQWIEVLWSVCASYAILFKYHNSHSYMSQECMLTCGGAATIRMMSSCALDNYAINGIHAHLKLGPISIATAAYSQCVMSNQFISRDIVRFLLVSCASTPYLVLRWVKVHHQNFFHSTQMYEM